MGKHQLRTEDGEIYELYVTEEMSFSNPQSIVTYEVVGRNGGVTLHTGAMTKKVTFSGKLYPYKTSLTLEEIRKKLTELADTGEPVFIVSPLWDGKSNKYLIQDFNGTITNPTHINFEMPLIEYGAANIRKKAINLVNYAPAANLLEVLRSRNITS